MPDKCTAPPRSGRWVLQRANECLAVSQPAEKCRLVGELWKAVTEDNALVQEIDHRGLQPGEAPGRPPTPELVHPARVPRRRLGSINGRAALIHAIAHIEFNAINLALDAVVRFSGMPEKFYYDWLSVAADEARHFQLLQQRLMQLGYQYGDFTAHNGLWEMAEKTAPDVLKRMALVPRVLEARGLDVTPGMMQRLVASGDQETADILAVILREEVGHVEIGSRWFKWCCEQRNLDAEATFIELLAEYYPAGLKGPFNLNARQAAGFSAVELRLLGIS